MWVVVFVSPVLFLVSFDVEFDGLAGYSTDAFVEVAVTPERRALLELLQVNAELLPQHSRAIALEVLGQSWNRVVLAAAYEQVHVLRAELQCQHVHAQRACFRGKTLFAGVAKASVPENAPPFFRRKLQVHVRFAERVRARMQLAAILKASATQTIHVLTSDGAASGPLHWWATRRWILLIA